MEGDRQTTAKKIEVWRSAVGTIPLAHTDKSIATVVTDDVPEFELDAPLWHWSNVDWIAERLAELAVPKSN